MIPNSIGYSFAVMMPGSNYPSVLSHSLPPKSLKQSESEKKTFATGKKIRELSKYEKAVLETNPSISCLTWLRCFSLK